MPQQVAPSGGKNNWATPNHIFAPLDAEFHFDWDVCAEDWSKKCDNYWSKEDNCLTKDWSGNCFMNPPYGKGENGITNFVKKAYEESQKDANVVVGLLPAKTDTKWFWDWVHGKAEIRFVKGRIRFEHEQGRGGTPTFPSIIVIWTKNL